MKQRHMIPVIPIHVIMAARAIITMDIRDTIARAEVDILAVIATAITVCITSLKHFILLHVMILVFLC